MPYHLTPHTDVPGQVVFSVNYQNDVIGYLTLVIDTGDVNGSLEFGNVLLPIGKFPTITAGAEEMIRLSKTVRM